MFNTCGIFLISQRQKPETTVPAFQLKHLKRRERSCCVDQRARRRLSQLSHHAAAAAACLHFTHTDIIWWKCPHSPRVWGIALNLIWSESHSVALQQLCIFTDVRLLCGHSGDKQNPADHSNHETSHMELHCAAQVKSNPLTSKLYSPCWLHDVSPMHILGLFNCNTVLFLWLLCFLCIAVCRMVDLCQACVVVEFTWTVKPYCYYYSHTN